MYTWVLNHYKSPLVGVNKEISNHGDIMEYTQQVTAPMKNGKFRDVPNPQKKPDKTGNKLVFSSKMVSSTNPLKLENSILLGTILGNSGDATASGLVH